MFDAMHHWGLEHVVLRLAPASLWLALIWLAEIYFTTPRVDRLRHGITNLSLAAVNGLLLFFTVGLLSVYVCSLSSPKPFGLIHAVFSFAVLDLFSYLWHRANHRLPVLWRFHAVHHSDSAMDVTTSGRFHFAELGIAGLMRLPVLYVVGVSTTVLLVYETALVAISMLHHSTIKLGRLDRLLRVALVTPAVHSVHHSRDTVLQRHNYASVLSIWDRLFRTYRLPSGPLSHGLDESADAAAVSLVALLAAPFAPRQNAELTAASPLRSNSRPNT